MTSTLVSRGLNWEQARLVVGLMAEERQEADRDGYERGYNTGYIAGYNKSADLLT